MTTTQINDAMSVLCPGTNFSFQLDSSENLIWIRLEQPGTCPTVQQIIEQISKGA